jgi:hypothetical protein
MKTWFDKKVLVGLALAAALTAPIASAKAPAKVTIPSELSYIQAPGSVSDLARFEGSAAGRPESTSRRRPGPSATSPGSRGFAAGRAA